MIQLQFCRGSLTLFSDITDDAVEVQVQELMPEVYRLPLTAITDALDELTRASIARVDKEKAATSSI